MNVTNTVALVFSTIGSTAGSRPELAGQSGTVRRLALLSIIGGATGAGLLLFTPPGAFERIVPFLVAAASVVLLLQPRISFAAAHAPAHRTSSGLGLGLLAVSVTGLLRRGGRGTDAGAVAGGLPVSLLQGNALKNVLLGLANMVAAIGFAVFGPVQWWRCSPSPSGSWSGAGRGPRSPGGCRPRCCALGIALAGLGLAVALGFGAY